MIKRPIVGQQQRVLVSGNAGHWNRLKAVGQRCVGAQRVSRTRARVHAERQALRALQRAMHVRAADAVVRGIEARSEERGVLIAQRNAQPKKLQHAVRGQFGRPQRPLLYIPIAGNNCWWDVAERGAIAVAVQQHQKHKLVVRGWCDCGRGGDRDLNGN